VMEISTGYYAPAARIDTKEGLGHRDGRSEGPEHRVTWETPTLSGGRCADRMALSR
jgi:hypothetical protein